MKTITRNSKNFLAAVAAVCLASAAVVAHADEAASADKTALVSANFQMVIRMQAPSGRGSISLENGLS